MICDDDRSLQDVVRYGKLQTKLQLEMKSYRDMMKDELVRDDDEMLHHLESEIQRLLGEVAKNELNIVNAILPKDNEEYNSDAIIEIRTGTGGDEAALFAKDLWDCLLKTIPNIKSLTPGWKVDILNVSLTDLGGLREGSLHISGNSTTFTLPNVSHFAAKDAMASSDTVEVELDDGSPRRPPYDRALK
jgi:peptide chain release factor 1